MSKTVKMNIKSDELRRIALDNIREMLSWSDCMKNLALAGGNEDFSQKLYLLVHCIGIMVAKSYVLGVDLAHICDIPIGDIDHEMVSKDVYGKTGGGFFNSCALRGDSRKIFEFFHEIIPIRTCWHTGKEGFFYRDYFFGINIKELQGGLSYAFDCSGR